MNDTSPKKNKIISLGATILFHVLVIVLLLSFGLPYQVPPPPEQGVEIDSGDLTDAGNAMVGDVGGSENEANSEENYSDDENVVTQNTENTAITARPNVTKTNTNKKPKPTTTQEPKVDNNALFHKGSVKGNGSGNGKGNGTGVGNGNGNGGGGTGHDVSGNGLSYNLNGRSATSLPKPRTNKQETGKVVVQIMVDQQGNVISAVAGGRGTTLMDTNIWRTCEQAAKKAKFTPKTNAPDEQRGTITYKFVQ
jgi:TonB family protein